ncbi:MAG: DedA family protein [Anaerolineales bacterium]|nr:DedA family protein [Anaerolineales bacterium]
MTAISISDLSDLFLTWMVTYGAIMLAVALFMGALGIPLPGTFFVIAAGAFVKQDVLTLYTAFPVALIGVAIGDSLSYGMGRFARPLILRRFGESEGWRKAENNLNERGGVAVYLTRWLLTPIAVPTNLVAGSTGYPFHKFVSYDVAGEVTWLIVFGGLGYIFGSQWEYVSNFISDFSGLIVGVFVLIIGVVYLLRRPKAETEEEMVMVEA